ncbi:MAG: hypothetical protein ABJZ55_01995 [Fuerstiella sp.]
MSDVVFQGNADFSSVEKAFQKLAKENLKLLDQVQKQATVNNKAASEDRANKAKQAQLLKEAAALMERNRTPVEKYNAELAKVKSHFDSNRISQSTFQTEKKKLVAALEQETTAVTAVKGSYQQLEKELADQVAKLKEIKVGTAEFAKQKAKVDQLTTAVSGARQAMQTLDSSVRMVKGSYQQLEKELADQITKLKQMKIGTAEFAKQKTKVDQLKTSVNQAKQAMSGMEQPLQKSNSLLGKSKGLMSGSLGSIGQMAAGYLSVQMAIQAVIQEIEKKNRLEKEAAGETRTLEQAIAANMMNIAPEERAGFRDVVREESKRLGVDQTDYANTAGIAISAGAGDLDRAKSILESLFTVTAGNAADAQALGGAALDFTTLAGTDDIEGAIGQLSATQQKVRATDPALFAKNIAPAIAAATAGGKNVDSLTVERGLELGAVISQLLKDTSGEKTATALNQFVAKMDGFEAGLGSEETTKADLLKAQKKVAESTEGTKARATAESKVAELQKTLASGKLQSVDAATVKKFSETRDFDARLKMMQANEALAEQFVDGLKEGKLKNALRELAIGSNRAKLLDADTSAAIPSMKEGRANFENLQTSVTNETKVLKGDRQSKANAQYASTDEVIALKGQIATVFDETLGKINMYGFDPLNRLGRTNAIESTRARGGDVERHRIEILGQELAKASPEDAALIRDQINVIQDLIIQLDAVEMERRTGVSAEQIAAFEADQEAKFAAKKAPLEVKVPAIHPVAPLEMPAQPQSSPTVTQTQVESGSLPSSDPNQQQQAISSTRPQLTDPDSIPASSNQEAQRSSKEPDSTPVAPDVSVSPNVVASVDLSPLADLLGEIRDRLPGATTSRSDTAAMQAMGRRLNQGEVA